jgi:hypothetical protein
VVQAIENWAQIQGELLEEKAPRVPAHRTFRLRLEKAFDLEGYPNLFHPRPDAVIEVSVPAASADAITLVAGQRIRCRARLVAPRHAIADPNSIGQPDAPDEPGEVLTSDVLEPLGQEDDERQPY